MIFNYEVKLDISRRWKKTLLSNPLILMWKPTFLFLNKIKSTILRSIQKSIKVICRCFYTLRRFLWKHL